MDFVYKSTQLLENKPNVTNSELLVVQLEIVKWASGENTCLRGFANNKDADQPAHLCSLISAIIIRLLEVPSLIRAFVICLLESFIS